MAAIIIFNLALGFIISINETPGKNNVFTFLSLALEHSRIPPHLSLSTKLEKEAQ